MTTSAFIDQQTTRIVAEIMLETAKTTAHNPEEAELLMSIAAELQCRAVKLLYVPSKGESLYFCDSCGAQMSLHATYLFRDTEQCDDCIFGRLRRVIQEHSHGRTT